MRRDYIITFVTEFMILASGILVYKLAANLVGKDGFSEYALIRRTVSFIQPVLLIGLGVGIPRYIGYAYASTNPRNSDVYFIGGAFILILVALTTAFILNLFRGSFAFLFFGNAQYTHLIPLISLMLSGLVFHATCYSYYRGRLQMVKANLLQIINLGFIPLFSFTVGKSLEEVLLITGLSWNIVSFVFIAFIAKGLSWSYVNIFSHTKELLLYGVQRVPGDFGIAALLSLPAIFTAHIAGVKEGGYVAFGTSLLNMIGAIFAPIGLILLPKASQLIASKDFRLLRYYVKKILRITFFLTAVCVVFFEIFANEIINLYLGKTLSDLILTVRIIIAGSLAYTIYVSMRSIIDAYYVKALNTMNIFVSLLLFLILSGLVVLLTRGYIYIIICYTLALFSLGSLTLLEIRKLWIRKDEEYPLESK